MTRRHAYEADDTAEPAAAPQPVATEPSPEHRAQELFKAMQHAAQHNSPITPLMLSEVAALVGAIAGKPVVTPLHPVLDERGHPGTIIFRKPDSGIEMVDTAEEALALVRTLPPDVQARPHWVAADKALSDAVASVQGSDISPATRQFEAALAKDRELAPREVEIPPKPEPVPA
jgi:hypothetical protein